MTQPTKTTEAANEMGLGIPATKGERFTPDIARRGAGQRAAPTPQFTVVGLAFASFVFLWSVRGNAQIIVTPIIAELRDGTPVPFFPDGVNRSSGYYPDPKTPSRKVPGVLAPNPITGKLEVIPPPFRSQYPNSSGQASSSQTTLHPISPFTGPPQLANLGFAKEAAAVHATFVPDLLITGFLATDDDSPYHAFRASLSGEYIDLGTLGGEASFGTGVNSVGAVVGFSWLGDNYSTHAFLWTESDGMVDLGSPRGPDGFSRAFGVSADSSVIVGDWSNAPGQNTRPFIWTANGGMQDLGGTGTAYAVTPDGSVVAGQANNATAFVWTHAGGMQNLGTLPGYSNSMATGVSDDGQVVVGYAANFSFSWVYGDSGGITSAFDTTCRAFIWTAATGMQDLTQVFAAAGVDMTGITLVGATGVSADGQIFCGLARTPQNDPNSPYDSSGFIAQLPH